jgi:hypothetical protein
MNDPQPKNSGSFEVEALQRVVTACEQFEFAWRNGRPATLEAYLERVEPAERDKLFRELLAIEIELRLERGEAPTLEEYQGRYPDWAEAAAIVFARDGAALSRGSSSDGSEPARAKNSPVSTDLASDGCLRSG